MELTFESRQIREAALVDEIATETLGKDLATAFLATVADMRVAMYLEEMPEMPLEILSDDELRLRYRLAGDAFLELLPLGRTAIEAGRWSKVHRVKLCTVGDGGTVLL